VTRLTDAVEKVFFGWSTKSSKTADALRARRPEDSHRFIQKRPPAFVLAPEYLAAAAGSNTRLSRDFRCLSIFDFFDSIDPNATSGSLFNHNIPLVARFAGQIATASAADRPPPLTIVAHHIVEG
jgi:hypothetical protein